MHVLKRQHEPQGKCIRTSGLECLAEMTLRDSGRQGSESFSGVALWATPCDLSCDLSLDTECGRGVGWFSYTSSRKRKEDKQSERKKHNNITTHTLFKPCEAKSAATDMNRWNGTAYICMHAHTQHNQTHHVIISSRWRRRRRRRRNLLCGWGKLAPAPPLPAPTLPHSTIISALRVVVHTSLLSPSVSLQAGREKETHPTPPSSGLLTFDHSCFISFAPFTHCTLQSLT